jgi:hypothetical protein
MGNLPSMCDSEGEGGEGGVESPAALASWEWQARNGHTVSLSFAPPLVYFIPELLGNSVPLFLKRDCDRTPGTERGVVRV